MEPARGQHIHFTPSSKMLIISQNPRDLDDFRWYKSLYNYSRPSVAGADEDDEPEVGSDGDLVSAMITTAVVPRLCKIIESGAFDPYSSQDVRTLVDLAEQIEATVERENLKFQVRG